MLNYLPLGLSVLPSCVYMQVYMLSHVSLPPNLYLYLVYVSFSGICMFTSACVSSCVLMFATNQAGVKRINEASWRSGAWMLVRAELSTELKPPLITGLRSQYESSDSRKTSSWWKHLWLELLLTTPASDNENLCTVQYSHILVFHLYIRLFCSHVFIISFVCFFNSCKHFSILFACFYLLIWRF